jgi:hypothetical protein
MFKIGFLMSKVAEFIGKIASSGATNVLDSVANNIDQFVETKDEKREALQALAVAQIELNKEESKNRNVFVSGWRPFVGWVCAIALAYNFIVRDLMAWVILNTGEAITLPPALAMEHLMTILLGMLGLGGLRTYEKQKKLTK